MTSSSDSDGENEELTFFENGEPSGPRRAGDPRSNPGMESYQLGDWINSYDQWKVQLPPGWRPEEELGTGGYGVAGLWKYHGSEDRRGRSGSGVNDIVIKQQIVAAEDGYKLMEAARFEAYHMLYITRIGSRHFPQLYDILHRDIGTGSHEFDPINSEVQRIVMEYIGRGDLKQWIRLRKEQEEQEEKEEIDEGEIWSIFVCLAKAIAVLDYGKENDDNDFEFEDTNPWTSHVIVHLDMRPDNIFLDSDSTDTEHGKYPRAVMGDLGVARWILRDWDGMSQRRKDTCLIETRELCPKFHQPPVRCHYIGFDYKRLQNSGNNARL